MWLWNLTLWLWNQVEKGREAKEDEVNSFLVARKTKGINQVLGDHQHILCYGITNKVLGQ